MSAPDQQPEQEWFPTADPLDTDDVRADYANLSNIGRDLAQLVDRLLHEQRPTPRFSYYYLLAGLALTNQLHYMEDILAVTPGRSAEVIARTMLEGFIKLSWVEQAPEDRALRWFNYAWLQEWKTLARQAARGVDLTADKARLLNEIKKRATVHLNPEGQRAVDQGADLLPFGHIKPDWTGKSAYDLAAITGLNQLHSRFYDPLSDWIHWSPKGFIKSANTASGEIQYTFRSYYQSVACLVAAIASLLGCLKIWARAFSVDLTEDIAAIETQFHPWAHLVK